MKSRFAVLAAVMLFSVAPSLSHAGVIGFLGNFDVINDTGKRAHGFEIDLEGLTVGDVSDTFGGANRGFPTTVERYGAPSIAYHPNSSDPTLSYVSVIYQAIYDTAAQIWKKLDGTFGTDPTNPDIGTPSGTVATPGDNCWSGGGIGYSLGTPCDHFGVGTLKNPTKTTYKWLVETPTAGILSDGLVNLPAVSVPVVGNPVQAPANPPQVQMIIQAPAPVPPPPGDPAQWGDPMWVKVFTFENPDPVPLEDLIFGRPPVDAALAEPPEIEWQLLQQDFAHPVGPGNGQLEIDMQPNGGKDAVVRRYEFYKYAGEVSAEGEANPLQGDSLATPCDPNDPNLPCDLGDYMGAQNAAINLQGNPLAVPAPEPGILALLGLGLAGLGFSRRRKA